MTNIERLVSWRKTIVRILLGVAIALLLRASTAQSIRRDIHYPEVPQLLEILRAQSETPEIFLKHEIDEAFIRKASALTVWNNPNPPIEQLAQHLYVGNMTNYLDKGLDQYDSNVERVLIQKADQAPPDLIRYFGNSISPIAWARGAFVIEHMGSARETVISGLRANLKAQEKSPYGKYRRMSLAGILALTSNDSNGLTGHLIEALGQADYPGIRIMAAESLGRMGLKGWPAAFALIRTALAVDPDVAAAGRRAILRMWLVPAYPIIVLQVLFQVIGPIGLAVLFIALTALTAGYLDAWRISPHPSFALVCDELLPSQRTMRWILFWGLCCSVPTFGFYIVAAGIVPAIWFLLVPVIAIFTGSRDMLGFMLIFNTAHFAAYGAIFFIVAFVISRVLFRIDSKFVRYSIFGIVVATMGATAIVPMYIPISHNSPGQRRSLLGILSTR